MAERQGQASQAFPGAVIAISDVVDVLAAARALVPPGTRLTRPERALVRALPSAHPTTIAIIRAQIEAGNDPLGAALSALRTPDTRRALGAVYTPRPIVESMIAWAALHGEPDRIVDPGTGTGRFLCAAATKFPHAELVGIDTDAAALLILRANAAVLGFSSRLRIYCSDYRKARVRRIKGRTLYIGNPPYVRHHDINDTDKEWFAQGAARIGLRASKLAGLHMHFFLRTKQIAQPGDYGAFVTSAEWLDVNYGSVLREMLTDGFGGSAVHVVAADAMPFEATTTAAITTFHVGQRLEALRMRAVDSVDELGRLEGGIPVPLSTVKMAARWSILVRGDTPPAVAAGHIELGEIFRVHRGQVTGANHVWIAGAYCDALPASVLFKCVTRAQDIIRAGAVLSDLSRLRCVIDLPVDLGDIDPADRPAVEAFLRWARDQGAYRPYVARHRKAWWAVGLRDPAPIVCTYMARRPPVFAFNPLGARHINIAHGLYPREAIPPTTLAVLARFLNGNVRLSDGRTYAGGLTKFEPREIQRLHIPEPTSLRDVLVI